MHLKATPENIKIIQEAVVDAISHGHVNFSAAFVEAFSLLKDSRSKDRVERHNNINFSPDDPNPNYSAWSKHLYGSNCKKEEPNQAIIMVTDGVPNR